MPLFQKTGDEDFPRHISALVSGPPKSGKTTFLSTVPNIVIADTEPTANGLQSIAHLNIPYVTVDSSNSLQQLLFVLRDNTLRAEAAEQLGMSKIEAVSVDTLDGLQELLKTERLHSERRTTLQRDDWGWLLDTMREIIRAFTALPLHVIFTVHTKTVQDEGGGENAKLITMPGLQGAIAEQIAGMVGYSLLTARSRELKSDGTPYTAYWLKAEGDDKHPHLGNRAAGRLPEILEPNFKALHEAVFSGLQLTAQQPADVQTGVQSAPVAEMAQNLSQQRSGAAESAPEAPTATPQPPKDDADEPVSAAALQHLGKVYEELGLPFPDDLWKPRTIGQAREFMRFWVALKKDEADGKLTEDGKSVTAVEEMRRYLEGMNLMPDADSVAKRAKANEPKIDGTIAQVIAYVDNDPVKAQEAYDLEFARGNSRATLLEALLAKGAKPAEAAPEPESQPESQAESQAEPGPESGTEGEAGTTALSVTPSDGDAEVEDATHDKAVATLESELGATVVEDSPNGQASTPEAAPCEECGMQPVDDLDIARLSKSRFKRHLCVSCYIAQTKKAKTG